MVELQKPPQLRLQSAKGSASQTLASMRNSLLLQKLGGRQCSLSRQTI